MTKYESSKAAWNKLSTVFNVHDDEIEECAADNVLIAWPPILAFIKDRLHETHGLKALDYGCGTGGFAQELFHSGMQVTGIDYAEDMIIKAKKYCDPAIKFVVGNHTAMETSHRFNLISSIMALQFIDDIEEVFQKFSSSIATGGLLVFAVFNPDWVSACLDSGEFFEDFDFTEEPAKGLMRMNGDRIPVFIRSPDEYAALATSSGFTKIVEIRPPFTKEFLTQYPTRLPTNCSEYLIMGFKKL